MCVCVCEKGEGRWRGGVGREEEERQRSLTLLKVKGEDGQFSRFPGPLFLALQKRVWNTQRLAGERQGRKAGRPSPPRDPQARRVSTPPQAC